MLKKWQEGEGATYASALFYGSATTIEAPVFQNFRQVPIARRMAFQTVPLCRAAIEALPAGIAGAPGTANVAHDPLPL